MQYESSILRPRTANLTDKSYGRWTVLSFAGYRPHNKPYWRCLCTCGTMRDVCTHSLMHHLSTSCGCVQHKRFPEMSTTHGKSRVPEYKVWKAMLQRCSNPNNPRFPRYGQRGIRVCDAWQDFAVFLQDMGPRPSNKHSIERKDNDGDYTPENCMWATASIQARNRRGNVLFTYNGVTQCMSAWAHSIHIDPKLFRNRLMLGWSFEEVITTPNIGRGKYDRSK